jgi:hypothetical protein
LNLYLDDNVASPALTALLRKAGHTVVLPIDVGRAGVTDPRHLKQAIESRLVMLTRNHIDFEDLHDLVIAAGGGHAGILTIRFDRDPRNNMKLQHIVAAIRNLQAAGIPVANQLHMLNQWR